MSAERSPPLRVPRVRGRHDGERAAGEPRGADPGDRRPRPRRGPAGRRLPEDHTAVTAAGLRADGAAIALTAGMRTPCVLLMILAAVPGSALAENAAAKRQALPKRAKQALTVTSSAFRAGEAIPPEYTCDGAQVAPPLGWSAAPKATRSIAVFVDDPDAPTKTFTHWLITGLPPTTRTL